MGNLLDLIKQDVRYKEALKACMNCGMCTAVCPAAEFYDYDPRKICDTVQRGDEKEIEQLLRSETIWYCGQCMSCKPRCPRGNAPGEVINILRKVSQELGYFKESVMGRQQAELMDGVAKNIIEIGYCVYPDRVPIEKHTEQGPIWKWYLQNIREIAPKLGANYHGSGSGALHDVPKETMEEIQKIFEVTGGMELRKKVLNK